MSERQRRREVSQGASGHQSSLPLGTLGNPEPRSILPGATSPPAGVHSTFAYWTTRCDRACAVSARGSQRNAQEGVARSVRNDVASATLQLDIRSSTLQLASHFNLNHAA